jgi:CRISPR-associated protein Cmr5
MATGAEEKLLKTLEQKRAAKAWAQVNKVDEKLGENYRSTVRKAPAMIKTNGLGQTLAFLLAKEEKSAQNLAPKKAEGFLYKHLEEWLLSEEASIAWTSKNQNQTLIERVIQEDSMVYRQATQEALAYLGWLKRFAEARFGGKISEGEA